MTTEPTPIKRIHDAIDRLVPRLLVLDPSQASRHDTRIRLLEFVAGDRTAMTVLCERFSLSRRVMLPIFALYDREEAVDAIGRYLTEIGVPDDVAP